METKRVTEDFGDRGIITPWTPDGIQYTMEKVEALFEECDTELEKAEMLPLGYEKQPISTMIEHMVILTGYVYNAHPQCYCELDHPLYMGFTKGATQTLSNIILEDITTANTFGMQEYVEVPETAGSWYMTEVKTKLTMADFFGLEDVKPGAGIPALENVESIGWFGELFRADYENMGAAVESLDQMLEIYLYSGEYSHKEYHPIGNLISGILDVTIIKPFIESIAGQDLITGEKLTDIERGMQFVNALVGAVTFGQGALALDFANMSGKEIAVGLVKIWAVDAVSDASAYTAGYACDELGMPAGVTFIASLLTGCTVSVKAGGYVFTDSGGKVVKELDADGMQTFLKEMDVDLDDMMWGSGKGKYKTDTEAYESLLGPMSEEELKGYVKFLENGSTAGLTPEELLGIRKVDEYLALSKVDYDEILALRRGLGEGGSDVLDTRNINGQRTSRYRQLSDDEILQLLDDIEALKADSSIFRFNEGNQTGFLDSEGIINVRGDVLPDLNSSHPRDLMSPRAVLAHEYYGHKYFDDIFGVRNPLPGSWNDEFRASYNAALSAPNLSDMDRMYLMLDALERAKEAGVNIKITDEIRRILYGY